MQAFFTKYYRIFFIILLLTLVGLAFYVGMLEGERRQSDQIVLSCSDALLKNLAIPLAQKAQSISSSPVAEVTKTGQSSTSGAYAGSKNGTKYYTPGCAGIERIKSENIIWFQSEEDARLQGYTAGQC